MYYFQGESIMTSGEIKQDVIELIYKLFSIRISAQMEDEWLTGEKIKLDGSQMVYLFDAVEKSSVYVYHQRNLKTMLFQR